MLRLTSAIAISTVLGSVAIASPCPVVNLSPKVVTHAGTVIEDGGGVLVGVDIDPKNHDWHGGSRNDPSQQPAWRFRDGKTAIAPTIETLAPGLALYRLPADRDSLVLETDKHDAVASVRRSPDRDVARLPAPMPTQISFAMSEGFRFTTMNVTVNLIATAPPHATAMIAYRVSGDLRVAVSWGPVVTGSKAVAVFQNRGACVPGVPGEEPVRTGDHVAVAWVDESGRVSALSREITVVAGKMP